MKPNIITFFVTILVTVGGYFLYSSSHSGNDVPLTVSSGGADNPAQVQFQSLVSQLQSISFNTNIFSDPHFSILVDITTPVTPEASGRLDPFAPVTNVTGS
jgi:hypothetical protein